MRLVAAAPREFEAEAEIETLVLSPAQIEYLDHLSRNLNPDMAPVFGRPHVVRTLLEKLEEAEQRRVSGRG